MEKFQFQGQNNIHAYQYREKFMGFLDDVEDFGKDFGEGFKKPFVWAYDKGEKLFNTADKTSDKLLDALPNLADDLSGLLKNPLLLIGGVIVVAIIVEKVL